ncbi:hypothetical protein MMC11_007729 [Xylographa trunciseda]|nr:hypothetical protein [Xylographa trunciseda]
MDSQNSVYGSSLDDIISLVIEPSTTFFTYVPNPVFTSFSGTTILSSVAANPPTSATSTASVSAFATRPTSQSPPSSATTQSSVSAPVQPSNSLSTGAKAGIGIGAVAGAVLLMLIGAFFSSVIRRRKRKDNSNYDEVEPEPQVQQQITRKELDGNNVPGRHLSRKELDGTHWKRELEGDAPNGFRTEPLQPVAEMNITGTA